MSFALDLRRIAQSVDERANLVVKKIVLDLGTALVMKSPVGNPDNWKSEFKVVAKELGWVKDGYVGGRFRGNWQYGLNAPQLVNNLTVDPAGTDTINRISAEIPEDATGKVHYLTNSLPYSFRLEHGYSKQAPKGMVGLTVIEFQPIVAAAAKELNP